MIIKVTRIEFLHFEIFDVLNKEYRYGALYTINNNNNNNNIYLKSSIQTSSIDYKKIQ